MKQFIAILWKERHEARAFLLIGLFVFLGLPLIGGLEQKIHGPFFELLAGPWVFGLGGVFAVFVGVAIGGRDLRGQLEDFWRSRPMNEVSWMVIKWAVGLAIVLVCLIAPLTLQAVATPSLEKPYTASVLLAWSPFLWAALYTLAFLIACFVRRGAHATMLALAVLLLVYFLPFVLPPLQRGGIFWVSDRSANPEQVSWGEIAADYRQVPWVPWPVVYEPRQRSFPIAMALLIAAALAVAVIAVRRGWRIESGPRTLYWSVGASLLILFSSAAFQLANNLPILQQIALPSNEHVERIVSDGSRGVVFTKEIAYNKETRDEEAVRRAYPIRVQATGVELGSAVQLEPRTLYSIWSPRHPEVCYCLHFPAPAEEDDALLEVLLIRLDAPSASQSTRVVFRSKGSAKGLVGNLFEVGNRLYLPGAKLVVFDISNPMEPKVVSTSAAGWASSHGSTYGEGPVLGFQLLQIPDFTPRQRLEVLLAQEREGIWALEGDILTMAYAGPLTTYHLSELTPQFARFDRLGIYSAPMLEQFFGEGHAACWAANGLVYESIPANRSAFGGSRITVFDVRNPARPRPVAHFAVPNGNSTLVTCPLPDGRALIGGERLYLVGPPPGLSGVSRSPSRSSQ